MTDPADTFAWLLDRARAHEANRKPVYLTVNPVGQTRPAWMRPATWLHPSLYADFPTPRTAGDTSPLNIALENLIQLARTCRDGGVIEVRSADLTVVVASYAVTAGAPVIFDWEGSYVRTELRDVRHLRPHLPRRRPVHPRRILRSPLARRCHLQRHRRLNRHPPQDHRSGRHPLPPVLPGRPRQHRPQRHGAPKRPAADESPLPQPPSHPHRHPRLRPRTCRRLDAGEPEDAGGGAGGEAAGGDVLRGRQRADGVGRARPAGGGGGAGGGGHV
jgi:hypothetical protein